MAEAPPPGSVLISGARPWGGELVDLRVRAGTIVERAPRLEAGSEERIDAAGCLLLPGLVDAHTHLDKTLIGLPWRPHSAGPRLVDKIANEVAVMEELGLEPRRQSARMVRHMLARGTTHIRSHVDIAPAYGLSRFHGVAATREADRDLVDLQIVAFPQTGMMTRPGVAELMEEAVKEGADAVGGLDPIGIDRDPRGQLDTVFEIAQRYGCEVDIHVHDMGETGAITLEMMAERTRVLGLQGRVSLSHGYFLGAVEPARLGALIDLMLESDIAVMTAGAAGQCPIPPIRTLRAAGVRMFSGSDGVRDTWTPLNNGDMLERAYQLAWHAGFDRDRDIETTLELATYGGARAVNAVGYGLEVGCRADLVLVEAETAAEAVCYHPARRLVMKRGRVVARDGISLLPPGRG